MKRNLWVLGALLLNSWGSTRPMVACGDKFISVATGSRFQRASMGRQESILVFNNPASDVPAALAKARPATALRSAGYRPTVVAGLAEFEEKVRENRWDLVVLGLDDLASAPRGATRILPVALRASKARLAEMRKSYPVVVSRESNSETFVRAVTEALASNLSRAD